MTIEQDIATQVFAQRDEAKRKAWDALGRYKFYMFGYWASAWVKYNQLLPNHSRLPNPFKALVLEAKLHDKHDINRNNSKAA